MRYAPDTIILKTRSDVGVKVTVTCTCYETLCYLSMHLHTKIGIPTSKNIGDMHQTGSRLTDWRTDRRTEEWTKQLLYASHSSIGGIKTVLLKTPSSWLPQTQCVYTVHHCMKPESLSDGRRFVILTSKWMLRCSLKFNPQSVIRYQQFALWVKMSICMLMPLIPDISNIRQFITMLQWFKCSYILACVAVHQPSH